MNISFLVIWVFLSWLKASWCSLLKFYIRVDIAWVVPSTIYHHWIPSIGVLHNWSVASSTTAPGPIPVLVLWWNAQILFCTFFGSRSLAKPKSLRCSFVSDGTIEGQFISKFLLGLRFRWFLGSPCVLLHFRFFVKSFFLIVLSHGVTRRIVTVMILITFVKKLSFDIFKMFSYVVLVILVNTRLRRALHLLELWWHVGLLLPG